MLVTEKRQKMFKTYTDDQKIQMRFIIKLCNIFVCIQSRYQSTCCAVYYFDLNCEVLGNSKPLSYSVCLSVF